MAREALRTKSPLLIMDIQNNLNFGFDPYVKPMKLIATAAIKKDNLTSEPISP